MIVLSLALAVFFQAAPPPGIAPLIAEARTIAKVQGDNIWPGFAKTPYPVLVVGEENSFLFCPAGPAKGFIKTETEPITGCTVKTRKRVFAADLKATFPAFDGIPTIVIGLPTVTEGNDAAWVSTLLHEHFHQMQMGGADYDTNVEALDLSGGDDTGMWMLDFPFPYKIPEVKKGFQNMAHALASALRAGNEVIFKTRIAKYRDARRLAFSHVSAAEARYAEFQLWQEGVSRYSEIALAEASIERFRRDESLHDYSALALNLRVRVLKNLKNFDLGKNKRVSFYALGAGEALLLDRMNPSWRAQYFDTGMAMAPLIYEGRGGHGR